MSEDLIALSACDVVEKLQQGEITPRDCLDALEARIAEADREVNALPTLCFERARKKAEQLTTKAPGKRGPLAGLPIPIKDLTLVEDVRTTFGSLIFENYVPDYSDALVERLEANGALIYAKSNTPEFGAGGHTFNPVLGLTRNPWNLSRSAAGSSGGAAAALASGCAWVAHGSDMGGSLRNPASFCGVVGLRPSLNRLCNGPSGTPFQSLSMQGPMARNVEDCALLLDAMVGTGPENPMTLPRPHRSFLNAARSGKKPRKVAFSRDLGIPPVDPQVDEICARAAQRFEEAGVIVEEAHPDLREAPRVFSYLRALDFVVGLGPHYDQHKDKLKDDILWNIELGLSLTTKEIAWAERKRGELYYRMQEFFETYDLLLCPATIVPPFPVEQPYVTHCNGQELQSYIDWLAIVSAITLTASPALSLPCGLTDEGLPVGLQMVGKPQGEAALLAAAHVLEQLLPPMNTPIDPRPGQ